LNYTSVLNGRLIFLSTINQLVLIPLNGIDLVDFVGNDLGNISGKVKFYADAAAGSQFAG
jgi:hypothetical protein